MVLYSNKGGKLTIVSFSKGGGPTSVKGEKLMVAFSNKGRGPTS